MKEGEKASVGKVKKFAPVRRKLDRRTTQIIIYVKSSDVDSHAIVEAYKVDKIRKEVRREFRNLVKSSRR